MKAPSPATRPYRELTVAAVVFGAILGALMTAAFVYVALKLGFTLPGSTVAAILGFAVLRGLLRRGSIVENNINQTVASSVNNASAGVAFTLPALFILGLTHPEIGTPDWKAPLLAAIGGSFLGVVVIIPLRKQMIEFERLRFPSGIAVGSLLKSPGAGMRQALLLGGGFLFASFFHVLSNVGILHEEIDLSGLVGLPQWAPLAVGVSFASIGAGLLSGSSGLPFVFGGMLAWWVISPVAVHLGWVPTLSEMGLDHVATAASRYEGWLTGKVIFLEMLRPMGIGVLIGGALSGVVASFPALKAAVGSLAQAARAGAPASEEMPAKMLYVGLVASLVILFGAATLSSADITLAQAALIAVVGTVWLGLAGLIVAQATGMTDISPISGMSLIGVTLMYFLSGRNMVASIVLGVAVSVGIGQCADMMTDLKSGHLIGAQPRRQQLAQFMTSWIGIPVALGVLYLLWGPHGGGFGPGVKELSAPQGSALAAVVESLAKGAAPVDKYLAGTAIGLGLGVFPLSGLGVLVGLAMYLPFYITLTYGVGCAINIALKRVKGPQWMGANVVPVAAGFIIGEALTSLTATLVRLATGS